jgi:hypothetical protein
VKDAREVHVLEKVGSSPTRHSVVGLRGIRVSLGGTIRVYGNYAPLPAPPAGFYGWVGEVAAAVSYKFIKRNGFTHLPKVGGFLAQNEC